MPINEAAEPEMRLSFVAGFTWNSSPRPNEPANAPE